jgi:threonine aldolase
MDETARLKESYRKTAFRLSGHGERDASVLKKAFEGIPAEFEADKYGSGRVIEEFQEKWAEILGKAAAVFFPSGTMAQQIALRIHCDEKGSGKVAYHPLSHLEIHEEDGLKKLHGIEPLLLADKSRVIGLEDIQAMEDGVACVLLELPQREIGGQLPSFGTLERISEQCREKGIKLHLDGARLFEVLPYYRKTAAEVCALFDSVYISMYKGIGGIAGAILAGSEDFCADSKVWKRRYGGDLISLYPYIVTADHYMEMRLGEMEKYFESAKELAALYNGCSGVATLPVQPVSNMFHVHFKEPKERMAPILANVHELGDVGLTSYLSDLSQENGCYFEVSLGDAYGTVPHEKIIKAIEMLDDRIKRL